MSINVNQFTSDVSLSWLCNLKSFKHDGGIVSSYDTELRNLIDKHAPVTTMLITLHHESTWFNIAKDAAKKERCRAEKVWKKTKLIIIT